MPEMSPHARLVGQINFRFWAFWCFTLLATALFFSLTDVFREMLFPEMSVPTLEDWGMLGADFFEKYAVFLSLSAACVAMLVAAKVFFLMLFYKLWEALPHYRARTTPLKATFLLLVPVFNLYWMFVVFPGYAKDANRVLESRECAGGRISQDVAYGMCLTALAGWIPIVGVVLMLACYVFAAIYTFQARSAALRISATNRNTASARGNSRG